MAVLTDRNGAAEPWQSTRTQTSVATQLLEDENDDLAPGGQPGNIGQPVGENQHELFVSCDAAEALQQKLEHLRPDFIALHDLGTTSTRQLLAGVAAASRRAMQKLVIRRQGYGTALATLDFVDLDVGSGTLRLYTTDVDADSQTRAAIARVLLGYSRLGVVMVGDLPGHLIRSSLDPLHEHMVTGPWHNRNLLLLPLASSATLAHEAQSLGRGAGVQVRTTPQVTRPADAWSFVSGTWNKLRAQWQAAVPAGAAAAPPGAPSMPAPVARPMTPMPTPRAAVASTQVESTLGRYVRLLSELSGVVSCSVFDVANVRTLVHAGTRPGPDDLALHGAAMLGALANASRTMGLGHALPEAAITLGAHHLLLRAVPKHPGVALHAVLDKTHANLTLLRLQIGRLDALFDEPTS